MGGGDWNTPSNWIGGVVPGAGDDARIQLTSTLGTVTVNSPGVTLGVNSISTNTLANLSIAAGTLSVGSTSILSAGLTVSGGILTGAGSITVNGPTTWTGGTISGAGILDAKAGLTLGFNTGNTASTLSLAGGRPLINGTAASGAANGAAVTLNVSGGSTITNKAGATFTFTSNSSVVNNGGSPAGGTFINQGTLGTNGGTGTTTIGIPITNTGTLQALTGILSVGAGGTFSSASQFKASSGAKIGFSGGTFSIPSGATLSGAGGLLVNGATVTFGGTFSATGPAQIESGAINFNTPATFSALTMNGGSLGGSAAVIVSGQTTWTGGTMTGAGSTEAQGAVALGFSTGTSVGQLFLAGGRSFINDGAASGAANGFGFTLGVSDGSTITNKSGATFTFTSNSSIANNGGSPSGGTFTNQGTLAANGGSGTSSVGITLSNTGTISVQTGTLDLSGTLTNFNAGTSTLTGGTYNVKGKLRFANANIATNAATIVLDSAAAQIRDLSDADALAGPISNSSGKSFTVQGGKSLTVSSFSNAGTVSVGSGSTLGTTTSYTQSGGTTSLNGSALSAGTAVAINGGSLTGTGTVTGNVSNAGQILPGGAGVAGVLNITGTYTQTSAGSLGIDIGGTNSGTDFDLLAVSGAASLNGALNLTALNSYTPAGGEVYRALTFASKTGDFVTKTGLTFGSFQLYTVFDATGMNLQTNVPPNVPPQSPTIDGNGSASFSLTATDSESSSSSLVFKITSLASGTVFANGIAVTVGQTFTGSPVALTYHIPNVIVGNFTDSFTFSVTDPDNGVTTSTVNLSLATPTPGVAQINGTSGNDSILVTNSGGNLQVTLNGVVTNTGAAVGSVTQINVFGLGGNDTIELSGLAITSTLDGGTGTNTIILDGTSGADTFDIHSATAVDINGAAISATAPMTINGMAGNDVFNLLAANLAVPLNGGGDNDSFVFAAGASLSATLNGGTGTNVIDMSAASGVLALNLNTSTLTGLLNPFTSIQSVIGGSNAGNNLTGPAAGSTFNITGANAGNVGGTAFSGFGKIIGGAGNDSFVFSDGAALSGLLNGGGGSNTINLSAYTTAVAANLPLGTVTGVGTNVSSVQVLIGSAAAGGTLTGPAAASTYNITGANAGNIGGLSFSNYSSLIGGALNDTFKFSNGASLSGSLNGGGGSNTIDLSSYSTPVALNLAAGTISGIVNTFSNLKQFAGGTAANSIAGPAAGSTFNLTGTNVGNVGGFNFSRFGTLIGGSGNDVFKFTSTALLTGAIDGGGGTNTLDYSTFATQVTLNLATSTVTSRVTLPFANIQDVLAGSFAGNPLIGPAASTTFNITGANLGNVNGLTFMNFARIVGGAGDDTFKFSDGASLSASIEGSAGTNVIDESAFTTSISADLATSTVTGLGLTFSNVRTLLGGSAANSLTGPAAASTYTLSSLNSGIVMVNGGGINGTYDFSGFGTLTGGNGGDTFVFTPTAVLSGTINGGGGSNTLDYSALTTQVTLDFANSMASRMSNPFSSIQNVIAGSFVGNQILCFNTATIYHFTATNSGNAAGIAFSNFSVILGGIANGTFTFSDNATVTGLIEGGAGTNVIDASAYTTPVSVNLQTSMLTLNGISTPFLNLRSFTGGSAANTLTGPDGGSSFLITALNTGTVAGYNFAKFGTLTGGSGNDSFVMSPSAVLGGGINGGAGTNTIDYSAFSTQVTLNLATSTVSRVTNPFANIQNVIGGGFNGNKIVGAAASTTFNVTGSNAGNVNGLGFSGFGRIVGGAGDDTFVLSNGAGLANGIDGGLGSNWLDYGAYTTGVTVNLATGAATGFGAAISNIRNVRGGSGNDTLTGNSVGNTLIGGAGNDTLNGGSGRSLLIGGTGADVIKGGSSDDILIGGTTSYDSNFAVLDLILAEWKTADPYATRVNLLKNGGGLNGSNTLVTGTSVIDDNVVDSLLGNAGNDWFFIGTGDTADNQAGEQVN